MAKIICDVCGTSYSDSAQQCPICGCVSAIDNHSIVETHSDADDQRDTAYTYVKGGRFSKSNVKKKNRDEALPVAEGFDSSDSAGAAKAFNSKGLMIVAIVALLIVIAVVVFLTVHFFGKPPAVLPETTGTTAGSTETTDQTSETTEATEATQSTTVDTVPSIPCDAITVSKSEIQLDKTGASVLLNVTLSPADTTDELVYTSSNESVVTVSSTGKVTAVAGGKAVITITCGGASAVCNVTCTMAEGASEPTDPSEESTEPTQKPTEPDSDFALTDARGSVYSDITLTFKGENYKLYNGDVPLEQITWSSDNVRVATFEAGVVKATGRGVTEIHAEYNGVKRTCIVRCSDSVGSADSGNSNDGTITPDHNQGGTTTGSCSISHSDVTIRVNETFVLTLVKDSGDPVFATWSVSNSSVCSAKNNIITGLSRGTATVSYTFEGVTYSCIVRVV